MDKQNTLNKSRCSPLASNKLLDSRASEQRGAETFEQAASRILIRIFGELEFPEKDEIKSEIVAEIREAVQAEREACAAIAERPDSCNNGDMADMIADKIQAMMRLTGKELKRIAGNGDRICTDEPDEITHITLHCAGLAQYGAQSTNYYGTISDEALEWLKLNYCEVEKLTDNYFISWENAPV